MKTTQFECPCGKIVNFVLENGIVVYRHEDDNSSCKLLNRFYKDKCVDYAWQRVWLAITSNDAEMFNTYMCIANRFVLEKLLTKLSLLSADETLQFFSFIFNEDIRPEVLNILKEEMVKEFGMVAIDNIKAYDSFYNSPNFSIKKPKRKMANISSLANLQTKGTKETIVADLARSFMIDSAIKNKGLKSTIGSLVKNK